MAQYSPRALELEEEAEVCTSTSEDESPVFMKISGKTRKAWKTAVGALCVLGACALALSAAGSLAPKTGLRPGAQPTTVRSLLESQELADLATDNVMAIGGDRLAHTASRAQVHAAVSRKLLNISSMLREKEPEAHKKLGLIQLSQAQKGQVLGVLRHYSDKRVIGLSHTLAETVQETARTSGDEAALKRRLLEKLSPRMDELAQLGSELFPSRKYKAMALNFDEVPVTNDYKKWHMQVQMSSPKVTTEVVAPARRLSAEDLASGVTVQASSMFDELGEMLGEKMPSAPARVLQEQMQSQEEESFMSCMMEQMSAMSVQGCVGCIFSNIKHVMSMVSKMLMGGMR